MQSAMRCAVAGATGLIGHALVAQLVADDSCTSLHLLVRRATVPLAGKTQSHVIDYAHSAQWPTYSLDTVFCALGTTIKTAGSKAEFRTVDFDYVIATAQWAKRCGAAHFVVVSAMGASPKSSVFYSQVKGEMEGALQGMEFARLTIVRPSMLSGPRTEVRVGERVALALMQPLAALIPAKYRAISDVAVARAMIDAAKRRHENLEIIESDALQKFT